MEPPVDWTAPAAPGKRVGPGLRDRAQNTPDRQARGVMDTLLGENRLAALDAGGGDPYNSTGRFFRR